MPKIASFTDFGQKLETGTCRKKNPANKAILGLKLNFTHNKAIP